MSFMIASKTHDQPQTTSYETQFCELQGGFF